MTSRTQDTIAIEDAHTPSFFKKIPVSVERGEGVWVWDEEGRRYLDFTAGWGVTCLGHASPVILEALQGQAGKIMQNPNSGTTYAPARARLLELLARVLPEGLTRVFFCNSGAEANDAVIKLARKVTGRMDVVSTHQSFHGRTISTASATGQAKHRERFNPLIRQTTASSPTAGPTRSGRFLDGGGGVAAVVLEPIQGEGGVIIPPEGYLRDPIRSVHSQRDPPHHRRGPDGLLPDRPPVRHLEPGVEDRLSHHGQGHRRRFPLRGLRHDRRCGLPSGAGRPRGHLLRQPPGLRRGPCGHFLPPGEHMAPGGTDG